MFSALADHLATWWGPSGNSLPRDEIEVDVRLELLSIRTLRNPGRHHHTPLKSEEPTIGDPVLRRLTR